MPRALMDDGAEIYYCLDDFRDPWITAPGETVLIHHGNVKTSRWWASWVPALARKYAVVRIDARGFGESSFPKAGPGQWPSQRYVQDAISLMDHLGVDRFHWIGAEGGAILGMETALAQPHRMRSLTLVGAPSDFWFVDQYNQPEHVVKDGILNWGFDEWLERTNFRRLQSVEDPTILAWYVAEMKKISPDAVRAFQLVENELRHAARGNPKRVDLLSQIKAPTLILVGDRNIITPVDDQYRMQRLIPNSRLTVFPNIAHNLALLMPDRCTAAVLDFLGSITDP